MLKMMVYGTNADAGTANYVLETDLVPPERCIRKQVALSSGASLEDMNAWEQSQRKYGSGDFPLSRLIPAIAIRKEDTLNPFAELYDDKVLDAEWDRAGIDSTNPKRDSWKAGYTYTLTGVEFNGSGTVIPITGQTSGDVTTYQLSDPNYSWLKVDVKNDDGTNAKVIGGGYYIILGGGVYASVENNIQFYDTLGDNTGNDRYAVLHWTATPISGIYDYTSQDFKCVQPSKTNLSFKTMFYHKGQTQAQPTAIAEYPIISTDSLVLTHSAIANSTLDIVVTLEDDSTNGTYWDSRGWMHGAQTSDYGNVVSVTKTDSQSTVTIDWAQIRQITASMEAGIRLPFRIYACWDKMAVSGNHMIGYPGQTTTLTATGNISETFTVNSAGNLNKTDVDKSVQKYYTCLYKVVWANDQSNIQVMPLEPFDVACATEIDKNIGGTYGLIYPTQDASRAQDSTSTMRDYVVSSAIIQNNQATLTINSTINNSPAAFTVQRYFPYGSGEDQNTFTINGTEQLTPSGSVTITPNSSTTQLTINFGNVSAGSAKWITLQQVDSREFANLSFTFNE